MCVEDYRHIKSFIHFRVWVPTAWVCQISFYSLTSSNSSWGIFNWWQARNLSQEPLITSTLTTRGIIYRFLKYIYWLSVEIDLAMQDYYNSILMIQRVWTVQQSAERWGTEPILFRKVGWELSFHHSNQKPFSKSNSESCILQRCLHHSLIKHKGQHHLHIHEISL